MSSALFVDTFTRDIKVCTVSVTEVARQGLVLRFGTEVGSLWQLTANDRGFFENANLPIIVATRGYKARSSAGFVEVRTGFGWQGDRTRMKTHVVAVQGFPWMKTGSLRRRKESMEVLVLRAGTNVRLVSTHARRGTGPYPAWHSNPSTARAAAEGLSVVAGLRPASVFVLEGQRDYTQAWEFAAPFREYEAHPEFEQIGWPKEHQLQIVNGPLVDEFSVLAHDLVELEPPVLEGEEPRTERGSEIWQRMSGLNTLLGY